MKKLKKGVFVQVYKYPDKEYMPIGIAKLISFSSHTDQPDSNMEHWRVEYVDKNIQSCNRWVSPNHVLERLPS